MKKTKEEVLRDNGVLLSVIYSVANEIKDAMQEYADQQTKELQSLLDLNIALLKSSKQDVEELKVDNEWLNNSLLAYKKCFIELELPKQPTKK